MPEITRTLDTVPLMLMIYRGQIDDRQPYVNLI